MKIISNYTQQNQTSFGPSFSSQPIQRATEQITDFNAFAKKIAVKVLEEKCDNLGTKLDKALDAFRANPGIDKAKLVQSLRVKYNAIYERCTKLLNS